jgi:hypothetical protein
MNKTKISFLKKIMFIIIGAIPPSAMAAPEAATVNNQVLGVNTFLEGLLDGDIGYLLTLIAFFGGIIVAIFKKEWMPIFHGFFVAVAILVVPGSIRERH